jgi:pimeloyl-ACP methyl ester carboxylesterase
MSKDNPAFGGFQRNYTHDWELAMLARAVYESKEDIALRLTGRYTSSGIVTADVLNEVENPRPVGVQIPPNWSLLGDDMRNKSNFLDNNAERGSGLTMAAFEGPGNRIVIAIRGTDGDRDFISRNTDGWPEAGANAALAADGEVLNELTGLAKGDGPKQQLRDLQQMVMPSWHRQFKEALDFIAEVRKKYPNHQIEVTGHSLGGSIAQLAAYTFGLNGAAFDPAGAANLIESKGYKEWLKLNGIDPERLRAAARDVYTRPDFANYLVNDSPVSEKSGPHLLPENNMAITSLGGRSGAKDYASYIVGKAGALSSDVVDALPIPPLLSSGPKNTARGAEAMGEAIEYMDAADKLGKAAKGADMLDVLSRHEMDRILRVMESAMEKGKLQQWGHEPTTPEHEPVARNTSAPAKHPFDPTQASHPDHTLYLQSCKAVHAMETSLGRNPDQNTERMIASMLPLAKENGLHCIDHVVLSVQTPKALAGANVFAVQGELNDPAHLRAHMPTATAIQRPTEESFKQLEQVNQRLAQERTQIQMFTQAEREKGQAHLV